MARARFVPFALVLAFALLLGVLQAAAATLAEREVWPNGITLLVAERPAIPIVTVRVYVRAGSVLDPPDHAGLANLTAELLTRGTEKRTGNQIDEAIEFVGGILGADAERDGATVSLSVLKKDLDLGLDLLAEVLLRPTFPIDELQKKVREFQAAIRRDEQNPESVARKAMTPLLFPGHPYSHPVVGTLESLGGIGRGDVEAFYRRHFRPDASIVVAVGDVKTAEIRQALKQRLGAWARPAGQPLLPKVASLHAPARSEPIQKDLTQTTIVLGRPSVRRGHPDYYPLQVASYILGGGSASRLYQHLREAKGLVYYVGGSIAPGKYGSAFTVSFQTRNEAAQEALKSVREEVARLGKEPVTEEELRLAKDYFVGSFPLRMDTNAKVAGLLLMIEEERLGLDYPVEFRRKIEAVTAEAIQKAVRAHLPPPSMSLVVVGDLKKAGFAGEPRAP